MTIAFILANIILVALVARRVWSRLAKSDSLVFWSALVLRLASGISVGLLYLYYYGDGDTFRLFGEAVAVSEATAEPRSLFFIYILRGVNILTGSNYWLTSLWLSLFSFICSYRLVHKLDRVFPPIRLASRIAFLFWPSVVFWTSGVLKETLAFGAVMILALYFISFMDNEKITIRSVIEIVLSVTLLFILKYYWAAVLIPSMITAFIIKKIAPKRLIVAWYFVVFVLLCVGASFTHPNFYLDRFLYVLVENHDIYVVRYPGNLIRYHNLTANWSSIFRNSPLALWSGLFRPMVVEISSVTSGLAAVENLVLLALTFWKIKSIRMPLPENRLIVLTVLVYVIVLCIFLALSTPNLGTLSRYRVGFLPFFVLLMLINNPILNLIHGKSSHHIRS